MHHLAFHEKKQLKDETYGALCTLVLHDIRTVRLRCDVMYETYSRPNTVLEVNRVPLARTPLSE